MKTYLSMGFGRNSVALYLLMLEQGLVPADPVDGFEAVFINHGADWPETYEYAEMFMERYPVTVLRPTVKDEEGNAYHNLIDYYESKRSIPVRIGRMCTDKFKVRVVQKYVEKPCFMLVGIDAGEAHRAKIAHLKGVENRWPLIEHGIDLQGCIDLIKRHGLTPPPKSGCYLCPFQSTTEYKRLRRQHPELYCATKRLESDYVQKRIADGKEPLYLLQKAPLDVMVNADWDMLPGMEEYEYPPCACGL
jgi:hypothetical protein